LPAFGRIIRAARLSFFPTPFPEHTLDTRFNSCGSDALLLKDGQGLERNTKKQRKREGNNMCGKIDA
jgi:hypothetical protein